MSILGLGLQGSISSCLVVAMAAQGMHLSQTDWSAIARKAARLLAAPVSAAGNPAETPPRQGTLALPTAPGTTQAYTAASPLPPSPASPADTRAPGRTFTAAIEVEREMGRLLDELRGRKTAPVEATPTMRGIDLARAVLANRLADASKRLETVEAAMKQRDADASAATAAEVLKPKAIFESMKPPEAAAILTGIDEATAAEIFAAMDERKAAAVLAAMPADRAARITLAIKTQPRLAQLAQKGKR